MPRPASGEEFARQLAARGTDLVLVAGARTASRHWRTNSGARAARSRCWRPTWPPTPGAGTSRPGSADARPVDLLVNNAGFGAYGEVADLDPDRPAGMIEVNVVAVHRLARAVLPGMVGRGRGGIINVASTAAFQPDPYGAVYGATKAYVLSLSQALHEEVRGTGCASWRCARGSPRPSSSRSPA